MRAFARFLFVVLVPKFEFAGFRKQKIQSLWPFPWKWSVWQNPDQERANQNARIYLKTILPYNKRPFSFKFVRSEESFRRVLFSWRIGVDAVGWPNHRNSKTAFLNPSGVMWTGHQILQFWWSNTTVNSVSLNGHLYKTDISIRWTRGAGPAFLSHFTVTKLSIRRTPP